MKQLFFFAAIVFFYILGASEYAYGQNSIDLCTQWRDFTLATESTSIALDGKYVWVGSTGGLIRFDTTTNKHELFLKTNSGLPVNWITCLVKDRAGALWVGTAASLALYNNGSWTQFNTHNSALPDSTPLCLSLDSSGILWVGTNGGLAKYDGSKFSFVPLPNLTSSDKRIFAMATDPSGTLWVAVPDGNGSSMLDKFDGTSWTSYTHQNSTILADQYILSIACANDGTVWLGFEYGIIESFDGTNFTSYTVQPGSAGGYNQVYAIAIDNVGAVWIADYLGVGKFSNNTWQTFSVGGTNSIVIDKETIWIGKNSGLVKLHGLTWDTFNDFSNSTLPANEMEAAVTVDQKGNTWAATFAGSQKESNNIAVFDGKNWSTVIPPLTKTNMSRPMSLGADSLGNVWIGMMDIGLVRYDGINWDVFNDANSALITNRIGCITYDKKRKNLWAGTYFTQNLKGSGCAVFDGTNWKGFKGQDMGFSGSAEINGIAVDTFGNVWAGAAYYGISRFDGSKWQLFTTKNSGLPDDYITSVASDHSGVVWIGTRSGVAKYDNGTWTIFNSSNSPLQWDAVTAVTVDSADRVWIGTFGYGAALYDHGKWTIYGQENSGVTNYDIKTIVTDTRNNVWFAMESAGLAEYSSSGFQNLQPLFSGDTVSGCDSTALSTISLTGDGCQNRKIISERITGSDSGYYRIIHKAVNPVIKDSIVIQFFPDTNRDYHAAIIIELEDGTRFSLPLSGNEKGITPLVLSSLGEFNDTIGASIDIPIIISHSSYLSSAELTLHYNTTMLVYQGSSLLSGATADKNGEKWTGRSRLSFGASDLAKSDTIAFAHFLIFPEKNPCADVIFDSLVTTGNLKNCTILANTSTTIHVCSTIGCGTSTLSNYLRYGLSPEILLSPNPTRTEIKLTSTSSLGEVQMEITDALGTLLERRKIQLDSLHPVAVDVNQFMSGVYFIRLRNEQYSRTVRFIHYK